MEQENILYEITQIQKITPNMFPHNLEASFYMYLYEQSSGNRKAIE